jgi:hypothetical protein
VGREGGGGSDPETLGRPQRPHHVVFLDVGAGCTGTFCV